MRGPIGGRHAELACVLGVQSLPAAELHGLGADDASNGLTGEKPLQHIEADVPARSAHRYEITVDVVPKREASAAARQRLQLPADVLSAPVEFEHLGRVGPLHLALGHKRRRRPHGRELRDANGTEVPVRIERSPFAKMLGIRQRLPNRGGRLAEVADEAERPLLPILLDLGATSGPRRVLLSASHVFLALSCPFLPFTEGTFSIFSKCCSRASTCFDQKRRKGASHASSSMSGSGLSR